MCRWCSTIPISLGGLRGIVDPLGRTTEFVYADNKIDLLEIRQTTGGMNERIASFTWNARHLPRTLTDASGQTTTFTYNADGQPVTVQDPAGARLPVLAIMANGYLDQHQRSPARHRRYHHVDLRCKRAHAYTAWTGWLYRDLCLR